MKQKKRSHSNTAVTIGLLIMILPACKKSGGMTHIPGNLPYQVTRETDSTWNSNPATYVDIKQTDFQYDLSGNQTGTLLNERYINSVGPSSQRTGTTKFVYDNEGFLIRSTETLKVSDPIADVFTSHDYAYEQGRLSKSTFRHEEPGSAMLGDSIGSYEYDGAGRPVTYVQYIKGNLYDSVWFGYSAGKLSLVSIKYASDPAPVITSLEVNEHGWVTKTASPGSEWQYQYDGDGELVEKDQVAGGVIITSEVTTYDVMKNPVLLENPPRKGFPNPDNIVFTPVAAIHNITHYATYILDGNNQLVKVFDQACAYIYNSKGYPSMMKSVVSSGSSGASPIQNWVRYTYSN